MNYDQIEGDWRYFKEQFREKWGKISDNDLNALEGKKDIFIGLVVKLKEKYGMSKGQAEKELKEFLNSENKENNEDYDMGGSG